MAAQSATSAVRTAAVKNRAATSQRPSAPESASETGTRPKLENIISPMTRPSMSRGVRAWSDEISTMVT